MVIVGICEEMCPRSEIKTRYEQGLLHILEVKEGTESLIRPLPDPKKMVKSFSRSAAGRQVFPKDLRTPKALQKTVNYLLQDVFTSKKIPRHKTYDFIADRLLAVRQDMVIQEVSRPYSVSLLQPIVRFYAYSSWRFCESPILEFDPVLNKKNLQECLKKLLVLYDEFDLVESIVDNLKIIVYKKEDFEILFGDCREFFEALYLLFNIGDSDCIHRVLTLQSRWRTKLVMDALKISLCYKNGNWVRLCRIIVKLPPLLAAVTSLHLPDIRRKALEKMSVAYSTKNLSYPTEKLQEILLYSCKTDLINDCICYNINCTEQEIKFIKSDFDKSSKTVQPKQEMFVIEKFRNTTLDLLST